MHDRWPLLREDNPGRSGGARTTAQRLRHYHLWLACGGVLIAFVIYESLTPAPIDLRVEEGDKFGHMMAYAVLMSWFANIYGTVPLRARIALGFVAMGIGLEFVQRLTGYRSFELADMAASAGGVLLGWLAAPPRLPNYLRLTEKWTARIRR